MNSWRIASRWFTALSTGVILVLAIPAAAAAQSAEQPEVSTRRQGNIVVIEASSQSNPTPDADDQGGGFSPAAVMQQPGPGWNVEWALAISSTVDNKKVNHYFARTRRLSGSGIYRMNAHATLIKGGSYGGEQVFSTYTNPCAGSTVTSGSAQTCISPWFNTSKGQKWYAVSGHWYDHGRTGTADATCSGCLDFVWTTP